MTLAQKLISQKWTRGIDLEAQPAKVVKRQGRPKKSAETKRKK